MATSTPYLNLALLATGESVGTWGIPLNNNFSKIDVLGGEVINARGSDQDLNGRFNAIEEEIEDARGVMPTLAERLNVLLQADGNIRIEAVPTSSQIQIGVTRLSVNPATVGMPIAVGDNDGRVLTQSEHDELVTGGNTALHKHLLINGASDVQATFTEINQAIYGVGPTVTSANLTSLTDGSTIPDNIHKHPSSGLANQGLVRMSVTPADINDPIAVGDNDPRVLTQDQHNQLVLGNPTALHKHVLADGASDVVTTATILNQLAGASNKVTASNLDVLVAGAPVGAGAIDASLLHNHEILYYDKTEIDSQMTALSTEIDNDIDTHNTSDLAHTAGDLDLGNITVQSMVSDAPGRLVTLRRDVSDLPGTKKLIITNESAVDAAWIDSEGNVTCNDITINGDQTILGDQLVTTSLTVDGWLLVSGDTTLGDGTDSLVANCALSTFNGQMVVNGPISGVSLYNGIDIVTLDALANANLTELTNARLGETALVNKITLMDTATAAVTTEVDNAASGFTDLDNRLDTMDATTQAVTNEINAASGAFPDLDARLDDMDSGTSTHEADNSNPHDVTITQSIAADGATNITTSELEILSDGSNADTLHFHEEYRSEIENSKTSPVLPGSPYPTMSDRLDAGDQVSENIAVELIDARTDIHASVYASLDARLDAEQLESETFRARSDNPHLVTFTQSVTQDVTTDVTGAEMETLTNTSDADALHVHAKYDVTTLEVEVARGGQGTLDARLDTMDSGLATHEARNDNPHAATITQAVAADAVSTLTIAALEGVTNGSDADGLHIHTTYNNTTAEVVAARDSGALGSIYPSLDQRLEVGETEIVNARSSDVYGSYSTLDGRLEAADAEVNTARGIDGALVTRLDRMDASINLNTAKATVYKQTVVVAATTWSVLHNLGTKDVVVTLYDASDVEIFKEVANVTSITTTDDNTVDIVFPANQDGRVIVTGV